MYIAHYTTPLIIAWGYCQTDLLKTTQSHWRQCKNESETSLQFNVTPFWPQTCHSGCTWQRT